jgi:ureidoacrylate peracid hydrolase
VTAPNPRPALAGGYEEPQSVELARSAVLVVDMTNDFGHPDGVYARNGSPCDALNSIVDAVGRLMTAAQQAGRPVILCSQFLFADRNGEAIAAPGVLRARPWLRHEGLRRNSWGTRILEQLPDPDITIDKPRASGFFATALDLLLRGMAIDTVVVVGAYTNQCIAATVRDAWALDYRVVLPPDGSAFFDRNLLEATLASLRPLTAQPKLAEIVGAFSLLGAA